MKKIFLNSVYLMRVKSTPHNKNLLSWNKEVDSNFIYYFFIFYFCNLGFNVKVYNVLV